jgi:maltoporin
MRWMRYAVIASALAAALVATSASAFEFHGYFRDGPGWNSKGGGQVCFQLPGSEFKARLGNECNHYYEFSLSEQIYKDDTGVQAKVEWMPAYGIDTTNPSGAPGTGFGFGTGNVYTQQIWGGIKLPQLTGATVWAGQRYYRRHNVEGLDWFYWNPYQGDVAAGIEDVDLGFGKLALTIGRAEAVGSVLAPANVVNATYMVPEARIYAIPLIPNGTLELGVDLGIAYEHANGLASGHTGASPWFTAEYFQDKFLGGFNKLTFQYAQGAEAAMNSGVLSGATSDPKQWRVVEQLVFLVNNEISGQIALIYQDQSHLLNGAPTTGATNTGARIFSAEVRPSYHFTDYFKLQLDALYQTLSVKDAVAGLDAANMLKLTVAPTLVTGRGFFARPEFRVFATYGVWNDAAVTLAGASGIANGAFGADKHGISFGAQMEAWF